MFAKFWAPCWKRSKRALEDEIKVSEYEIEDWKGSQLLSRRLCFSYSVCKQWLNWYVSTIRRAKIKEQCLLYRLETVFFLLYKFNCNFVWNELSFINQFKFYIVIVVRFKTETNWTTKHKIKLTLHVNGLFCLYNLTLCLSSWPCV
jgi:hypothetical protein